MPLNVPSVVPPLPGSVMSGDRLLDRPIAVADLISLDWERDFKETLPASPECRTGESQIRYHPDQHWHYFSKMAPDECLLSFLKCFDSGSGVRSPVFLMFFNLKLRFFQQSTFAGFHWSNCTCWRSATLEHRGPHHIIDVRWKDECSAEYITFIFCESSAFPFLHSDCHAIPLHFVLIFLNESLVPWNITLSLGFSPSPSIFKTDVGCQHRMLFDLSLLSEVKFSTYSLY